MNSQENQLDNENNKVWSVINDQAELDDLMNLALRDLQVKFDEHLSGRFEDSLDQEDEQPDFEY